MGHPASDPEVHICLLGGFGVVVAGQPVAGHWRLRKAQTLVKILALAPGHRLHREQVFETLWPAADPHAAANNLHQIVHNIRRMIGAGSIALDGDVVRLGPSEEVSVDVDLFEDAAARARRRGDVAALEEALRRWTGPLLPEDRYADWAIEHRERLTESHAAVATLLASKLSERGDHEAALALLEPLGFTRPHDEHLNRVLIETLAASGRRWEAIEAYERLRDALDEAYAAEPGSTTKALYRRLLTGGQTAPHPPARNRPGPNSRPLVGREREWQELRAAWQRCRRGESHLLLIDGVAGIGKTRLAEQLLAWVDQQGFATSRTRCYGAEGRLTLAPAIEWLRSRAIRKSLNRLDDPSLIEISRLLPELLTERPALRQPQPLTELGQRFRFFEALSRAVLVAPQPLLLMIDDLQWCDPETLQWLRMLLAFDAPMRLMILGTARVEELVPAHPVARWLLNLRSGGRLAELTLEALGPAETAQLAAQVINRELNDPSASRLYGETEGNPLYVVEMASAGLGEEARRRWRAGRDFSDPRVTVADLPPRVHAVIAGRLAQLTPLARELAGLAGVIGRGFTTDVLRAASGFESDSLTNGLDELWHRRILRSTPVTAAADTEGPTGEALTANPTSFDFSHDLLRDVAYAELSPMKQRYWHLRVAEALVAVSTNLDAVSAQLAAHYEQAGEANRAIPCYQRAAEVAQRVYAHDDAIGLLQRGLKLLDHLPDNADRARQQFDLLRLLGLGLVATRGYGAPEVMDTLSRMQVLNSRLREPPDPPLLRALAIAHLNQGTFGRASDFGEQLLELARQQGDPILLVEAHYVFGVTLFWTGSFVQSRGHLQLALADYRSANSPEHVTRYSQDPSVICQCRLAFDLWCLGYPDQAKATQAKGMAQARELAHPFSLAYALTWDAMLHGVLGEFDSLVKSAEAVITLQREHPLGLWSSWARLLKGWALAETGRLEPGVAELQWGDQHMRDTGGLFLQPFTLALLGKHVAKLSQHGQGLTFLDRALDGGNGQSWFDAELHRLRGSLLLACGSGTDHAEAAYQRAIQIAQTQQAKLFELRATTSLARQWLQQGKRSEARHALHEIYAWFTEGLDTPDLQEARTVLSLCG